MGRDNAKPVAGLQGGTAPAKAFHDFMVKAVARRPVVPFNTKVTLPDWQLEPEEEALYGATEGGMMVDENGNPVYPEGEGPLYGEPPQTTVVTQIEPEGDVDQQWLDGVLGRDTGRARPFPERGDPPPPQRERQPLPEATPPPEEVQFRPVPS